MSLPMSNIPKATASCSPHTQREGGLANLPLLLRENQMLSIWWVQPSLAQVP
jgi:hypothetical protein